MKELKEIHIGDDRLTLQDSLVKTGILPRGSKELGRAVVIQGNVEIDGPVYGQSVMIENGPATFRGPVYAHGELHVESGAKGEIVFCKAVGSADSIVALASGATVSFGADVNAKTIKLRNAYVAASIFAEEISLENCVVLGGVFATKKAAIQNSIVGTFNSPEIGASGMNYLLYPSAFSVEPVAALPGTEIHNLALADLGALYKGVPEKDLSGKIPLDLKSDAQRTVLVDGNQNTILVNSYSVAGKVLVTDMGDLDKLENHFLLTAASLGSQLFKTYSFPDSDSKPLTTANIREFFFGILSGRTVVKSLSGTVKIEDIRRAYGDRN